MGSYKMFGIFNRKFKTDNRGPPEDVVNAFNRYSDGGEEMSPEQLLRFLTEFQGEADCTLSQAEDIIRQVLHQRDHEARRFLTMEDFCYFLVDHPLNPPIKSQIHQDMDAPLSHYFIYTGHNSYLTGNQLSSDCSDAPIIEALQKGVRVIELDIWPNSDGDDVNVLHGRFTQRNILRVYPKGIRFDSSNYNPLIAWTHGAQMVAFNMQGYGRSLWLMHGMFRANGGCGYVKKPDILLKAGPDNEVFDPETALPIKTTLKVTVYTGEGWCYDFKDTHYDAYSPPDFYARIGIAGVEADTVMKKSKTVKDTWIPNWNEEFEFPLTFPELALLRFEVHEYDMSEKDDFGGQTCLPVSELRSGIRAVPLYSKKGDKYNSVKVLLRFEFV